MVIRNSPGPARVWEYAQALLICANLTWTTLCLGGVLAQTKVITATLTATLLVVHAGAALVGGINARHPSRSWVFLPFVVYVAVNVAWVSPVPWLGWFDWFGWLQLIAVFWVTLTGVRSRRPQWLLLGTLLALAVIAVLLGSYQRFVRPDWLMLGRIQVDQYAGRASGPFGIPNSLAAFLLLLVPLSATLTLRRAAGAAQRVLFGWVTLVLVFGLVLTISRGAWIGFAIALTAWPIFAAQSSWRRRLGLAGVALIGVLLCGAVAAAAAPKVRERFAALVHDAGERSRPILWRASWKIFRTHPLFGGGGGSFNVLFERYRPEGFLNDPQWAHNEYLNTLSDYGAVGFMLFFGAAAVTLSGCLRRRRTDRAASFSDSIREVPCPKLSGAGADVARPTLADRSQRYWERGDLLDDPLIQQALAVGLLAFALQMSLDFHFKIPALAMSFGMLAGLLVQRRWRVAPRPAPAIAPSSLTVALAGIAAGVIAMWIVPQYRAEALRQHARGVIESLLDEPETSPHFADALAGARRELLRATILAPTNAQAWADVAYVDAQQSRFDKGAVVQLGREAEGCADRAIALAPVCAEYWVRRGVARDMQGRWVEAGDDFVRAITLSPNNPLTWYHHAYHLSLRRTERDMADAAAAFCLRLDPKNRDGLRLRQRLATGRSGP